MADILHLPSRPSDGRLDHVRPVGKRPAGTAEIAVLFTGLDETLAALRAAARLGRPLGAPLRVVDVRVVPFGADIEAPPGRSPLASEEFLRCVSAEGLDIRIDVYLCRDAHRAVSRVFQGHSLILIGARRPEWSIRARRWRRVLERRGHVVALVDCARMRDLAPPCEDADAEFAAAAGPPAVARQTASGR